MKLCNQLEKFIGKQIKDILCELPIKPYTNVCDKKFLIMLLIKMNLYLN